MMGLVLPPIPMATLAAELVLVDLVVDADDRKKASLSSAPLLLVLLVSADAFVVAATLQLCWVIHASAGRIAGVAVAVGGCWYDDEDRLEWLPLPLIAMAVEKLANESTPIFFLTILLPPLLDTPPVDILAKLPMVVASCGIGLPANDDLRPLPPPLLPMMAALLASGFCWLPLIPMQWLQAHFFARLYSFE